MLGVARDKLVDGLSEGRWAVIMKVHHALVDGVSGTSLYRVIFDLSAEPPPLPPVGEQPVPGEPSGYSLLAVAVLAGRSSVPHSGMAAGGSNPSPVSMTASDRKRASSRRFSGPPSRR